MKLFELATAPIANSSTSSSVTTVTFTGTKTVTSTQQIIPSYVLGIPPDLWVLIIIGLVGSLYLIFKFQVKGTPTFVTWIFKNYSAKQFAAQEDLGGIFLNIINARGKKAETLKKTGLALEVDLVDNKGIAYYIKDSEKDGEGLDQETISILEKKGFKVTEERRPKNSKRKGYLIQVPSGTKRIQAYLDIAAGGLKHFRNYFAVEGTGETVDLLDVVDGAKGKDPGNSAVIHEERSAAKEFLKIVSDAMKGTWQALLLPLGCGFGFGAMLILLIMIITGHLK